MGLLGFLPGRHGRADTAPGQAASTSTEALQVIVDKQNQQLQQQEAELQRVSRTLASLTGPSHQPHSDHPGPYAHLHAHPFARLSAQPAQQISILSVSSQAGTDWAFEPDAAFESADEQSPESQLSPRAALSRYESTIGDNGTTVYAPSVASSTGLSLAASQLSSKDHNAALGHVRRMQPRFDARVRSQAVLRLLRLARGDDQVRQLIAAHEGIPLLLAMLQGSDPGLRDAAMHLLWVLSRDGATRRQVAEQEFVGVTVTLLHDASHSTARAAASLLHNCAVTPALKAEVAAAGGVCALVRLLCEQDEVAMPAAASALHSMASGGPGIRKEMRQAGAVPALVHTLRSCSKAAQSAARTLKVLCEARPGEEEAPEVQAEAAQQAVGAGGVDALVDVLRTGLPPCQAAAAGALRVLAGHEGVRERMLSKGRVIPLVEAVRSGTLEGQVAAAALLRVLAQEGRQALPLLLEAGAAEALVDLAACSDCNASMTAASLTLLSLAQGPASQHALIVAGGVRALLLVLANSASAMAKDVAARALTNLTSLPEGKAAVHGLGAADLLVTMAAQAPTPGLALACGGVLVNLARAPQLRASLCASPSLPAFLALARDGDSRVGEMAVCVLRNLAGKGSDMPALVAGGAVDLLLHIMATCAVIEHYDSALAALNRLACAGPPATDRIVEAASLAAHMVH